MKYPYPDFLVTLWLLDFRIEDDVSSMLFQNNNDKQCIAHSLLYKNKKLDLWAMFFFIIIRLDARAKMHLAYFDFFFTL